MRSWGWWVTMKSINEKKAHTHTPPWPDMHFLCVSTFCFLAHSVFFHVLGWLWVLDYLMHYKLIQNRFLFSFIGLIVFFFSPFSVALYSYIIAYSHFHSGICRLHCPLFCVVLPTACTAHTTKNMLRTMYNIWIQQHSFMNSTNAGPTNFHFFFLLILS